MKRIIDGVYTLWPTIEEMAEALMESPRVLRDARERDRLPDEKHDRAIVVRARAIGLRRITLKAMHELRRNPPAFDMEDRRNAIAALYGAAGGIKAAAERVGITPAFCYANKTRGYLNRTNKHEWIALAEDLGFYLPPVLFAPPR